MKVSWDNRINSCPILIRTWILLSLIILSYYKFDNKDNLPKNTLFVCFPGKAVTVHLHLRFTRQCALWFKLCFMNSLRNTTNKPDKLGLNPLWCRLVCHVNSLIHHSSLEVSHSPGRSDRAATTAQGFLWLQHLQEEDNIY